MLRDIITMRRFTWLVSLTMSETIYGRIWIFRKRLITSSNVENQKARCCLLSRLARTMPPVRADQPLIPSTERDHPVRSTRPCHLKNALIPAPQQNESTLLRRITGSAVASSSATMAHPYTKHAPWPPCLLRWRVALKGTSLCIRKLECFNATSPRAIL